MIDTPEDIYDKAQEILQTINDVYNEAGILLPSRQYVIVGDPAFDCEQVTVSFGVLNAGLPGETPRPQGCVDPTSGTFTIDIVRELPQKSGGRNGKPIVPSTQELTETAKRQMIDARLLAAVCYRIINDEWFPGGTFTIVAGQAEGAMQTMSAELSVIV